MYEKLAGWPFGEDIAATVLTEACVPEPRPKREMSSGDVSHRVVRDNIAYIERRDDSPTRPVPMDIGNQAQEVGEAECTFCVPELQKWGRVAEPWRKRSGCTRRRLRLGVSVVP